MFNFIGNARLKIRQALEWKTLQKQKDVELKVLRQKKQFEINKTDLEREAELEELKANIRKEQAKSLPKPGQQKQEKKTAFAAFQDYCSDFASKQQSGQSIAGNFGTIGLGNYDNKRKKK